MTLYEKLFDLKYRQGVPTYELAHLEGISIGEETSGAIDKPEKTVPKNGLSGAAKNPRLKSVLVFNLIS